MRPSSIRNDVVFPAPFGPEVAEDVAALDVEIDAVHRDEVAVPLDERSRCNRRGAGHATSRAADSAVAD